LNFPSGVYITESALQGASVEAIVGTMQVEIFSLYATAFAVSRVFPPPIPAINSQPKSLAMSDNLSISSSQHSPPNFSILTSTFFFIFSRISGRIFSKTNESHTKSPFCPNRDISSLNSLMASYP